MNEPFLPPDRTAPAELAAAIARAAASPVVTALLDASEAAAAVLDANRQVIAFNGAYLAACGVEHPEELLGLRPGEGLACGHVEGAVGGCGTTSACPSCGAALAILAARRDGRPAERRCALRTRRDGAAVDRDFRARASPLALDGTPLLLLTLHDVTDEARRTMLERSFVHDLANLVMGLQAAAAELAPGADEGASDDVRLLADQLAEQVRLQKLLARDERGGIERLVHRPLELSDAIALLRRTVEHHPARDGRAVEWPRVPSGLVVRGDLAVLHHVLLNMALNALEAIPPGARVRVEVAEADGEIRTRVWNPGAIPAAVAPRIFQRYFSTKTEPGRGHGTWAMKHFGEELLGGRVSFTTSAAGGTAFEIALPRLRAG